MDFEFVKLVLNDFTLKQLSTISWLNNKLDKNIQHRNEHILQVLREHCAQHLNDWTPVKIGLALIAIDELGFLNQQEENELNESLRIHLEAKNCANTILEPYVKKCCGGQLKVSERRNIKVFGINKSYIGMIRNGECSICGKKYSHNYFTMGEQKFVTYESVFSCNVVYFGGEYAYEHSLMKALSNSVLYLHCGFENYCKCYNETKKWTITKLHDDSSNLSPTRLQDFWFLYNFVTFAFFYTEVTIANIPYTW